LLPTRALAEAVAAEWQCQGEEIRPADMPFTQLANSALDMVAARRQEIIAIVVDFANADLLCYQVNRPEDLAARQLELWAPIIGWAERRFDVEMAVTTGIGHIAQSPAFLAAYRRAVEAMSDFQLAALHEMATLTQSISIALALSEAALDLERAWTAARVDEDYQAARWGLDAEAAARADRLKRELAAALDFFNLVTLSQVE
jgi:chaperone required for assembly of F1-ATPase